MCSISLVFLLVLFLHKNYFWFVDNIVLLVFLILYRFFELHVLHIFLANYLVQMFLYMCLYILMLLNILFFCILLLVLFLMVC